MAHMGVYCCVGRAPEPHMSNSSLPLSRYFSSSSSAIGCLFPLLFLYTSLSLSRPSLSLYTEQARENPSHSRVAPYGPSELLL